MMLFGERRVDRGRWRGDGDLVSYLAHSTPLNPFLVILPLGGGCVQFGLTHRRNGKHCCLQIGQAFGRLLVNFIVSMTLRTFLSRSAIFHWRVDAEQIISWNDPRL
jgi:hypothetical protein